MQGFSKMERTQRSASPWNTSAMQAYSGYMQAAIRESELYSGEAYAKAMSIRLTD